jgi:hypothetical protein
MLRRLCLAAALVLPLTATAADTWHGQIQCVAIPGVSTLPLVGDFEMAIDGSRLTYTRPVHITDQASLSGVQERGTGMLNGNAIKLQGGASGQGYNYTSAYQGQIDGGHANLNGEQIWTWSKSPSSFHRGCQITLNR